MEPPVQQWNELLLEAIRNDLARPNVHARNLHHFSSGQYALQLLTEGQDGTLADGNVTWPSIPGSIGTWTADTDEYRDMMATYAYRFIALRYAAAPGWSETAAALNAAFVSTTGTTPNVLLNSSAAAAFGFDIANAINLSLIHI